MWASRAAKWLPWALAAVIAAGTGGGAARAVAASSSETPGATAHRDRLTRVVLKVNATIEDATAETIRLRDVAEVTGPLAETLGEIAVAKRGETSVSLGMVRSALDAARVHWGQVALSGSTCTVQLVRPAAEAPPRPVNTGRKPDRPAQIVDVSGPPTVRTLIALRLSEQYGTEPGKLRIAFDPALDAYLDTPVEGRRVDVQTRGRGDGGGGGRTASAGRVTVNVAMYADERVESEKSITVEVLIERTVVTASETIGRGDAIAGGTLVEGVQWLAPSARTPATLAELSGAVASRRIAAGQIIGREDVETPVIVKRGDIVWVHALSGPVTVKAKCRALGQARDGEIVQLKLEGSNQVFTARMSGRGRAVSVVGAQEPGAPAADGPSGESARGTPVDHSGKHEATDAARTPEPRRGGRR